MKIFITGGTGFVGSHLLSRLNCKDNELLVLTRNRKPVPALKKEGIEVVTGNLSGTAQVKVAVGKFNPEVCIHLAWQDIPDYSDAKSRLNFNASIDLLDFVIKKTDCRKIIASGSCFEYGKKTGSCRETDKCRVNSFFAWAKQSLYAYLAFQCSQNQIDLIWFRIFYVYGPGQRKESLIPLIVRSLKEGAVPQIRNPFNASDFIYVGDVAEAFKLAVYQKAASGIYNLGSGKAEDIMQVCRIVEKQVAQSSRISNLIKQRAEGCQAVSFWANGEKTKKAFSWSPSTSLAGGISQYIQSEKENHG